jgi:starch synthase
MNAPLHILFATPECAPWVKTGGLGDVCGALPQALTALGHEVRVLIPMFEALAPLAPRAQQSIDLPAQGPWPDASLRLVQEGGLMLWLLDCPALYGRPSGPYLDGQGQDFTDNAERFGFLSHVAARLSSTQSPSPDWPVDVLHCHDWTVGLAPAYLQQDAGRHAVSVMTIHNLLFQGPFPAELAPRLAIPPDWLSVEEGLLHWDRINFLKAGLRHADMITTVSPTYAREIQGEALGCGLDGMLRLRSRDLVGILNGIDTAVWQPAADPLIAAPYDAAHIEGKALNKQALRQRMGLAEDPQAMLLGLVSRMSSQKGIDLVLEGLPVLMTMGCQLCVLGTGDKALEEALVQAAASYPGNVAVHIGFDEALAHLIEAGADAFLMPSLFEPCGLNQMYSQAYGTPPIVRAVGGLVDSVVDDIDGNGTGFLFDEAITPAFLQAVQRARAAFDTPERWRGIQQRAMARDNSWAESARHYTQVYEAALVRHRAVRRVA